MWFRPRIVNPDDTTSPCLADDGSGIPIVVIEVRPISARPSGGSPTVHVVSSTVWVTQEGRLCDHIVHAGGCLALDRHGRIVIHALTRSGARVRIADSRPMVPR